MSLVRSAEARRTSTPNGVMTTFASPTLGGADQALWRVEMAPGATGPVHAMDSPQVWTVLDGGAVVTVAGEDCLVGAGDTLVLDAGVVRRIAADGRSGMTAIVTGRGGSHALRDGEPDVVPPWIA